MPYQGDRDSFLTLLFERLDALHQQLNDALSEEGPPTKALKLHADIMSVAKEIDRVTTSSGKSPPYGKMPE